MVYTFTDGNVADRFQNRLFCNTRQYIQKFSESPFYCSYPVERYFKHLYGQAGKICTYLADNHINILDISQTIVQGFFNMMMIVDVSKMNIDFVTLTEEISKLGEDTGVQVKCQREDIFDKMHRI